MKTNIDTTEHGTRVDILATASMASVIALSSITDVEIDSIVDGIAPGAIMVGFAYSDFSDDFSVE